MISTAAQFSITGAGLLARVKAFLVGTSYGVIRQRVGPDRQMIDVDTTLTFQSLGGESEEVFVNRIQSHVHEGDMVEWRVKADRVYMAEITRRPARHPIAQHDARDWTVEEFMAYYREFYNDPNRPRA